MIALEGELQGHLSDVKIDERTEPNTVVAPLVFGWRQETRAGRTFSASISPRFFYHGGPLWVKGLIPNGQHGSRPDVRQAFLVRIFVGQLCCGCQWHGMRGEGCRSGRQGASSTIRQVTHKKNEQSEDAGRRSTFALSKEIRVLYSNIVGKKVAASLERHAGA